MSEGHCIIFSQKDSFTLFKTVTSIYIRESLHSIYSPVFLKSCQSNLVCPLIRLLDYSIRMTDSSKEQNIVSILREAEDKLFIVLGLQYIYPENSFRSSPDNALAEGAVNQQKLDAARISENKVSRVGNNLRLEETDVTPHEIVPGLRVSVLATDIRVILLTAGTVRGDRR